MLNFIPHFSSTSFLNHSRSLFGSTAPPTGLTSNKSLSSLGFTSRSFYIRSLPRGHSIAASIQQTQNPSSNHIPSSNVKPRKIAAVLFDMDGTMTVSNIDFPLMRERTGIARGDLFTVMQEWTDDDQIKRAICIIEEMEEQACKELKIMPGLTEVLEWLRKQKIPVGLVTRNTKKSVRAFFDLIGEKLAQNFSIILTRDFQYVKPDKRILEHVAETWSIPATDILMIGDSREDVEVGNAAGSSTCLLLGGGNEVEKGSGKDLIWKKMQQGQPTFQVADLHQLKQILESEQVHIVKTKYTNAQNIVRNDSKPLDSTFIDHLFANAYIKAGYCTYPRLTGAFGGEVASTFDGDHLLHLSCGDGLTTKLFGSVGVSIVGVDINPRLVSLSVSRGLSAKRFSTNSTRSISNELYSRWRDRPNSAVLELLSQEEKFDGILFFSNDWLVSSPWFQSESTMADLMDVAWDHLKLGGHFALEIGVQGNVSSAHTILRAASRQNANLQDAFPEFPLPVDVIQAGKQRGLNLVEDDLVRRNFEVSEPMVKDEIRSQIEREVLRAVEWNVNQVEPPNNAETIVEKFYQSVLPSIFQESLVEVIRHRIVFRKG